MGTDDRVSVLRVNLGDSFYFLGIFLFSFRCRY
jgi:hypothetical protein